MRKTSLWGGSTLAAALMIGMTSNALADDHGFYADVSAGAASYPVDLSGKLNGVSYDLHENAKAFSYSFAVGYRINRYVGVEAGFIDYGNPNVNPLDPADSSKTVGRTRFSAKGKSLSVLAHLPT